MMAEPAATTSTEKGGEPTGLAHVARGLETPADAAPNAAPSLVRAWFFLVWLSIQRQARMRQMIWIALALLGFTVTFVALFTAGNGWDAHKRKYAFFPRNQDRVVYNQDHVVYTYKEGTDYPQWELAAAPRSPLTPQWEQSVFAAAQAILDNSSFTVFAQSLVLNGPSLLLNFLLPIWTLSFATDSIGGDRESRNLIWLLTRPLPRPLVYLAKFTALLPWTLGLNVGGFGLICLAGGQPGREAFVAFWPAVVLTTLAFSALFLLIGTYFRRPAVIAIVYSFFLEIILGSMPGFLKRASISFYARCMMYEAVAHRQIGPRFPQIFLAVDGTTAWVVLVAATVGFLVAGMVVFARMEYHEIA
jgi:ABC-type transport system involved in multi-copper enzyme maturation permease subunit